QPKQDIPSKSLNGALRAEVANAPFSARPCPRDCGRSVVPYSPEAQVLKLRYFRSFARDPYRGESGVRLILLLEPRPGGRPIPAPNGAPVSSQGREPLVGVRRSRETHFHAPWPPPRGRPGSAMTRRKWEVALLRPRFPGARAPGY